jgi:hypothetical protein
MKRSLVLGLLIVRINLRWLLSISHLPEDVVVIGPST